jgi:hypothetical protein
MGRKFQRGRRESRCFEGGGRGIVVCAFSVLALLFVLLSYIRCLWEEAGR